MAEQKPVRQAATVVVLRPAGDYPELFMVRRSARSSFMPDALVFPGGAVDPEDGPAGDDESFVRAARREAAEEAALRLGDRQLRWFDTWMTPSAERKRFVARFFLTEIAPSEGHDARHDGHETVEGRWASAPAFLDLWRDGSVDLPPPTLSVLLALADPGWTALRDANEPTEELRRPILPKIRADADGLSIVMPHAPDYDAIDGEALVAPARSNRYPLGFLRQENRWVPK